MCKTAVRLKTLITIQSARTGLAASLVGYVLVIGLGRAGMLHADIGFGVALGLIVAMAVCAVACLTLQIRAWARRGRDRAG